MTRTELFETATERYQQLKQRLEASPDVRERYRLRLEIISLLDVILFIIAKTKHLSF